MTVRKCPSCKNMVAVDTWICPICGCNPRLRRLRQFVMLGLMLVAAIWAFHHWVR